MIPEFKPKTDQVSANEGMTGAPKEPANKNQKEITSEGSKKAADIGASLSPAADAHATEVQTPARRKSISAPLKGSEPKITLSYSDFRKLDANAKLFEQRLTPGYQKLLTDMAKYPKQLDVDIGRLGTVIIGNTSRQSSEFAEVDADKIYSDLAGNLKKYISEQNPNLKTDNNKIDEILYSATQNASLDLMARRGNVIPDKASWVVQSGSSAIESGFNFEKTWFSKSDVLVVNKKVTQEYINIDDLNAKPKTVVMDARIKHNLKTKDVSYEYEITVTTKGNSRPDYKEIWDPTKENWNPPKV